MGTGLPSWAWELAAIGPVGLGLLARRGLEANGQARPPLVFALEAAEVTSQRGDGAAVAHGPDLLDQPHGREPGFCVAALQVVFVGVELGGAVVGFYLEGVLPAQDPADGVAGVAGERGDGPDGVAFLLEFFDAHGLNHLDHGQASPA